MDAYSYPNLSSELRSLVGDALQLWGDADARRRALLNLLAAWDRGDRVALERALLRVDGAMAAGLVVLNLRRDPGVAVQLGSFGRGWIGRVGLDGDIRLDMDQVRHYLLEAREPDRVIHTLVHESLHARAPAAATRGAEASQWKGYQEGMVEGLARCVTSERAGMRVLDPSYSFYVASYRALAAVAGLDVEALWRALWRVRPGEVRAWFTASVNAARQQLGAATLSAEQHRRLGGIGDRVFAGSRSDDRPDERALVRSWEVAFR